MGVLRRMGKEGDLQTSWEVIDEGQVREAQTRFDEMVDKGGLAFRLDTPTGEGEPIKAFDPTAKEIVVIPRIAGGCR